MAEGPASACRPSPKDRVLEVLLETSQYGLMLLDEDLSVAWISDAGAAAVRYRVEEVVGRKAAEFLDSSQSPGVLQAISEVLAGTTDEAPGWQLGVRVRLRCGDGKSRDFEFGGRLVPDSGSADLMLLFLDVSERARLEDVLTAVMERDLDTGLQRFVTLASSQLRAPVGIALHPSLGGATYTSADASEHLLANLAPERADARVQPVISPLGSVLGWFVVDRGELAPWSIETIERLVALLGLVLSNQATFTDLIDAAATDPLTGLSNRRVLDVALAAAEATAAQGWALLYCDLDRFKSINDEWGHDAGDVVLRAVADRLRQAVRTADLIARIGGDEYVILLQADLAHVEHLVQRLRASVQEPIVDPRGRFEVGISVGVATADTRDGVRTLLADGDRAMRADKAAREAQR
ncbi:MAG: diguanylate cyclase domain-containing protein [Microthrixaceae bacterium]